MNQDLETLTHELEPILPQIHHKRESHELHEIDTTNKCLSFYQNQPKQDPYIEGLSPIIKQHSKTTCRHCRITDEDKMDTVDHSHTREDDDVITRCWEEIINNYTDERDQHE